MDMVKDTQDRIAAEMRDVASRTGDRTSRLRLERWADLLSSLPPVRAQEPTCPTCGHKQSVIDSRGHGPACWLTPEEAAPVQETAAENGMRLRTASESVGWMNSEGPLTTSPSFPAAPSAGPDLRERIKSLPTVWASVVSNGVRNKTTCVALADVLALVADAKE